MTEPFDLTDYGELYMAAVHARAAGFPRVQIDPEHAIAMYQQIQRQAAVIEDCAKMLDADGYVVTARRLREGESPYPPVASK